MERSPVTLSRTTPHPLNSATRLFLAAVTVLCFGSCTTHYLRGTPQKGTSIRSFGPRDSILNQVNAARVLPSRQPDDPDFIILVIPPMQRSERFERGWTIGEAVYVAKRQGNRTYWWLVKGYRVGRTPIGKKNGGLVFHQWRHIVDAGWAVKGRSVRIKISDPDKGIIETVVDLR
jgi:hypothetical protein